MRKLTFYATFVLTFCLSSMAWGAVAFDASSTVTGSLVDTLTWSHTVTGSNPAILCAVHASPHFGDVLSYEYNSVGLTKKYTFGMADGFLSLWVSSSAPANGAHNATFLLDDSTLLDIVGSCTSLTGVGSIGAPVTGSDHMTGLAVTVPADGMGFDVALDSNATAGCGDETTTGGGTQTERFDNCEGVAGNASAGFGSTITSDQTMSWAGASGAAMYQIAVPISPFVPPATGMARRQLWFH